MGWQNFLQKKILLEIISRNNFHLTNVSTYVWDINIEIYKSNKNNNNNHMVFLDFDPEIIVTKSLAAAGLCSWVRNIMVFHYINETVKPLRAALAQANAELKAAMDHLNALRARLAVINFCSFYSSYIIINDFIRYCKKITIIIIGVTKSARHSGRKNECSFS